MLFSVVSHFGSMYFRTRPTMGLSLTLLNIGMVATPTFILVSGLMLGFLHVTSGDRFGRTRAHLIDRGLFLLLVGHVAIGVATFDVLHAMPTSLPTDAIGVALVLGPILVTRLQPWKRFLLSAAVYVLAWLVVIEWRPHASIVAAAEAAMVGAWHVSSFPVIPWTCVYLVASVYGERLGRLHAAGRTERAASELGRIAGVMVLAAAGIRLGVMAAQLTPATAEWGDRVHEIFALGEKYPPGPTYLLFFGGVGVGIVALWIACEARGVLRRAMMAAAGWGEASLAIFIVQFYVLWLVVAPLTASSVAWAAPTFVAIVALLTAMAAVWRRVEGNRLLTVGYRQFYQKHAAVPRNASRTPPSFAS